MSPLEKSTRYVWFDKKSKKGEYSYYREPEIMASKYAGEYAETCDFLFDTYASLVEPMTSLVKERFPREEGVSDRAYAAAVKAKAATPWGGFLPLPRPPT